MRFLLVGVVLGALAAEMPAATVDVSLQTTQVLQAGDSLTFLFADSSFARLASSMGLNPDPSQIFFNLVSAPVVAAGQFTVAVESAGGSAAAMAATPVDWSAGVVEMSKYSGAASVVTDSLKLSSAVSQEIFTGPEAELIWTYMGPDITVGLPGYTLENDLTISLAGGPITVGAMDYGVTLDTPVVQAFGAVQLDGLDPASAAPEPESAALVVALGMALCAASFVMKRLGRSR